MDPIRRLFIESSCSDRLSQHFADYLLHSLAPVSRAQCVCVILVEK